jgi:CysZ protein
MTAVGGEPRPRFVGGLREGVMLLAEGGALLRRERSLWLLASVPVFLAFLLVGAAAVTFWLRLDWIHAWLTGWLPILEATDWWTWIWVGPGIALFWLLGWLAVIVAFGISWVVALLLASLASAPFLDRLSQRVEQIVSEASAESVGGPSTLLGETLRSFAAELRRIGFLGGVWLLISGAGLVIPGAQLLTGPLLVGVTVLFLPLDYCGFALDRRQIPFALRRRWLWQHRTTMAGFGGVAFLACSLPGVNLVALPALVTAGTLLVLRHAPHGDESTG